VRYIGNKTRLFTFILETITALGIGPGSAHDACAGTAVVGRELKRAGWRFWRVRESEFAYDPDAALATLWETLNRLDIKPIDAADLVGAATEATVWQPAELSTVEGLDGLEGDMPEELDDVGLPSE